MRPSLKSLHGVCSKALFSLLCGSTPAAFAVVETAVQLDATWSTDNNPYRLPNDSNARQALGRDRVEDQILSHDLRVALIAPVLSDQTRLEFVATISHREYGAFKQLSHDAKFLDSRFIWQAGRLFRGRLRYSEEDSLFPYQDSGFFDRDMNHVKALSNEVALRMTEDIEFPFTLERTSRRQDLTINQRLDRDDTSAQLTVRHATPMGSSVQFGFKYLISDYPNRTPTQIADLDSRSIDRESFLDVDWAYSPITRLGGRFGNYERRYRTLSQRDFSRPNTLLRVVHDYSYATRLTFSVFSQSRDSNIANALYYLSTGTQAEVNWRYSPLLQVRLQMRQERQEYQSVTAAPGNLATTNANRFAARVDYQVTRDWRLYLDASQETLTRSAGQATIHQKILRTGLVYTYENLGGVAAKVALERRP